MPDDFTIMARGDARRSAFIDELDFDAKFQAGKARWHLNDDDANFLNIIYDALVINGRPVLSNRNVRRAAQYAMIDIMLELEEWLDDYPCYFATFCWDEGLTWESHPYVSYPEMQTRVYHALRRFGLVGFQVMEFDTVRPLNDGPGHRQFHHVHCVVWKPNGKFKPRVTAKKLMSGRSFPNDLDAPSVNFRRITPLPSHFARVGGYMLKLRAQAKNRVPRRIGGFRLRKTRKGFTPGSAVRMIETLSHVSVFDVVRGIGPEGRNLVRRWKEKTRANLAVYRRETRRRCQLDETCVSALWASIRENNGSEKFRECTVITSSNQRYLQPRPKEPGDTALFRNRKPSHPENR